jgi:hypothetical protein
VKGHATLTDLSLGILKKPCKWQASLEPAYRPVGVKVTGDKTRSVDRLRHHERRGCGGVRKTDARAIVGLTAN